MFLGGLSEGIRRGALTGIHERITYTNHECISSQKSLNYYVHKEISAENFAESFADKQKNPEENQK